MTKLQAALKSYEEFCEVVGIKNKTTEEDYHEMDAEAIMHELVCIYGVDVVEDFV